MTTTPDDTPARRVAEIAEIQERLKAATPGPWEYRVREAELVADANMLGRAVKQNLWGGSSFSGPKPADGHFIAHAPTDIALLLSSRETMQQNHQHEIDRWLSWRSATVEEIETLETRIKELEGQLQIWRTAKRLADPDELLTARQEAGEAMRERCNQVKVETIELCRDAMCCDCMAGVEYENCYHIHAGGYTRPCGAVILRSILARAIAALPSDTQGRGDGTT